MKRKYTVNESAFEEITEESAYWIGFLMADGCITTRKSSPYLNLRLSETDVKHIEKFRSFLESDHKIKLYKNTKHKLACLQISSYKLAESLALFGVTPRKSLTAQVLQLENNKHFWRGMIDGDGWIYTTFNNLPCIGLCSGSETLIKQFYRFVEFNTNSTAIICQKRTKFWTFQTAGTAAQQLIELLYENCNISLDRKSIIANQFINNPFVSSKTDRSNLLYEDMLKMYEEFGSWKLVADHLEVKDIYKLLWRKRTGKR